MAEDELQRVTALLQQLGNSLNQTAEAISKVTSASSVATEVEAKKEKASIEASKAEERNRNVVLAARARVAGVNVAVARQAQQTAKAVQEAVARESGAKRASIDLAKAAALANTEEAIVMSRLGKTTRSVTEGGGRFAAGMDMLATAFPTVAKAQDAYYDRQRRAVDILSSVNSKVGQWASTSAALGPVAALAALAFDATVKTLRGGVDTNKILLSSITRTNAGIMSSVHIFSEMAFAAAKVGASSDEALSGLNAITKGYALNSMVLPKAAGAQQDYLARVGAAIGTTMGYGKVLGLSADQTGAFANALGIMGADMTRLDDIFAKQSAVGKAAGLTVEDYSHLMVDTAKANLLANGMIGNTNMLLLGFARALKTSDDQILQNIRHHDQAAAFASAINQFVTAANRLDVGHLMAVAGLKAPGGDLSSLVEKAATIGKPDAMVDFLSMINDAVTTGSKDQIVATTFALNQMGMEFSQARVIAATSNTYLRDIKSARLRGDKDAEQAAKDQLGQLAETAAASAAIKDPLEYIARLLERILGLVVGAVAGGGVGMLATMGGAGGSTGPRTTSGR